MRTALTLAMGILIAACTSAGGYPRADRLPPVQTPEVEITEVPSVGGF